MEVEGNFAPRDQRSCHGSESTCPSGYSIKLVTQSRGGSIPRPKHQVVEVDGRNGPVMLESYGVEEIRPVVSIKMDASEWMRDDA